MKLVVISRYRTAHVIYEPGQVLEVSELEAQRLLADSPGSFAVDEPAPEPIVDAELHFEAPEAPPADKMIRGRRAPNP